MQAFGLDALRLLPGDRPRRARKNGGDQTGCASTRRTTGVGPFLGRPGVENANHLHAQVAERATFRIWQEA